MYRICCPVNSQKTPHTSPFRASYGVSFMSTSTEIDRVIKGFYCINLIKQKLFLILPVLCLQYLRCKKVINVAYALALWVAISPSDIKHRHVHRDVNIHRVPWHYLGVMVDRNTQLMFFIKFCDTYCLQWNLFSFIIIAYCFSLSAGAISILRFCLTSLGNPIVVMLWPSLPPWISCAGKTIYKICSP